MAFPHRSLVSGFLERRTRQYGGRPYGSRASFPVVPALSRATTANTPATLVHCMASAAPVLRLSNELLRDILDYVEADPDQLVTLDRRGYLSQESFRPPTRPSRDQAVDLGNFRLTCRRFSELGAIHQFARITTRFSRRDFKRLEWLASRRHLARNVRKFSYMVPMFYSESKWVPDFLFRLVTWTGEG